MGSCCSAQLDSQYFIQNISSKQGLDSRICPITNPTQKEIDQLVQMYAESFSGNDGKGSPELTFMYWFGKENKNNDYKSENGKALFDYYCRFVILMGIRYGAVYAIQEPVDKIYVAIAIMFPPNVEFPMKSICKMINIGRKTGAPPNESDEKKYGKLVKQRGELLGNITNRQHQILCPEPHWYLNVLAVSPDYQGKGYGKMLMNLLNVLCDNDKVPGYLECSSEKNTKFYQKFGYEKKAEEYPQVANDPKMETSVNFMKRISNN